MKNPIKWLKSRSMNEKLMWALILALLIGILTRWQYVISEISDAFSAYFQ